MPTTWTNDQKLVGQASIKYDDSSTTYDQMTINYQGQQTTVWSNDAKS